MSGQMRVGVVIAIAMCTLTGCAAPVPVDSVVLESSTSASPTPVFATEQEALEAATKAYTEYLAVSDAILADGGKNPERIREVVTAAYSDELIEEFEEFERQGFRSQGSIRADRLAVQTVEGSDVVAYACSDVSGAKLLNADGDDITPASRVEKMALVLHFSANAEGDAVVLEGSEIWAGDDFCS